MHKRSLVADTPEDRARKERLDLSGDRWLAPLPMYHAFVNNHHPHLQLFCFLEI
jgi:hypothetical protein